MLSAELTSIPALPEPVAGPSTPHPRSPHAVVSGHGAGSGPLVYPKAAGREATAQSTAKRSRGSAAFHAIALWLLRVLTDSAGAWALAAGAPLDPYNAEALAGGIVTAINPTYAEAEGRGRPGGSGPRLRPRRWPAIR